MIQMNARRATVAIVFCFSSFWSLAAIQCLGQPTIVGLGALPGGSFSIGNGLSADGTAVTGYSLVGGVNRAFRWTQATGMQDLGSLPGYSNSIGQGINGDGSVVVGGSLGFSHAWRWTQATGMQDLGTLPGGTNSVALGISADGNTVGGWSQFAGGVQQRAFRWTSSGGMVDIGFLPGGSNAIGFGVSGDGQWIAGSSNYSGSGSATHAALWSTAGVDDLGAIAGSAAATAISHDGSVVVGWTSTNNGSRAFRWTSSTGMVNLGVVQPAGTFPTSAAFAVSGNGLVIGGEHRQNEAFLWRADLGMVDLKTWLLSQGVNVSGWSLNQVRGLSYDGSVIMGTGFFDNAQQAWIVDLNASGVPEPSAAVVLAGLLAALRLTRRCRAKRD